MAKPPPVRRSLLLFNSSSSRCSFDAETEEREERGCLKLDSANENSESAERRRREESPPS